MKNATFTPGNQTDATRALAYRLWEEAGRPDGQDCDFWLRAEQQLLGERQGASRPHAKPHARAAGNGNGNGNGKSRPQPAAKKSSKSR